MIYFLRSAIVLAILMGLLIPSSSASAELQPAPIISSISPSSGPAGINFPMTLTGSNFGATQGTSRVEFWYTSETFLPASIISWSDTQIVCTVPPHASNGYIEHGVRVVTPAGISNSAVFKISFSYFGAKWSGENPTGASFFVNLENAPAGIAGAFEAVMDAAQTWNSVMGANFYFEYGGSSSIIPAPAEPDGMSEVFWVNTPYRTRAGCNFYKDSNGNIVEFDLRLNSYYSWTNDPNAHNDVQAVITHEFGHALGLADISGEEWEPDTMGVGYRILGPGDLEGIRWIYPGSGTRGQYHVKVTNNDDDPQTVYFKSDIDSNFTRSFIVPAGQTVNSWWEVVPAGSHQASIQWIDPDKGIADTLNSISLNLPVEEDTEFNFTIPQYLTPVNHPPVLDPIGNKTVNAGQALTFTVSAADADNDPLTYSASSLPAGATFNTSTHVFSWTPATTGTYSGILFSVTDGKSTPVTEAISVTVSNGDMLAPTVTLSSTSTSPTTISPIPVTVTFSEPVTGFTIGDITAGNGTAGNFVAVSSTVYTFSVTPTAQGVVTVDIAAGVAQDGVGNNNTAAAQLNITYDSIAPTVTVTSPNGGEYWVGGSSHDITWTANDINMATSPITIEYYNGTDRVSTATSEVNDGTYTWTVPSLNITTAKVRVTAVDSAGNSALDESNSAFTIDSTAPTVTLSSTSTSPTTTSPIPVTVIFSEAVTGFTIGDITVGNGTIGSFVAVSATVYTFNVTPAAQGAVTVDIGSGVAQDAAGNNNTAAEQFNITYDSTSPTVTLSSTSTSPTKTSPFPVTATFSEPVTGFAIGDITVGNGTADSLVAVSTTVYTFNVTPAAQGTVTIDIAAGVAQDAAGNNNTTAARLSEQYSETKGGLFGCGRSSAKAAISSTGLAIGWALAGLCWGGGYTLVRKRGRRGKD